MAAMSESFVDLTYRGLALGRRVKLSQVRPTTGYLELPAPMPVGTQLAITTDDGLAIDAIVAEIHEQVGGSEIPPGMLVKPTLAAGSVASWWSARVALPELAPEPAAAPAVDVVRPKRDTRAPELIDDGRDTGVMAAATPVDDPRDTQEIENAEFREPTDDGRKTTAMAAIDLEALGLTPGQTLPIVDDGKRTVAMAAIDLEALGLDASASTTGSIPVMGDDETSGDKPTGSGAASRRKRKRR